ncbi:hypothetical protein CcaverHIS002_0304970 [Cutaneotrichosporon cavernicola]|uniref:GATA-type domain-containing protein n=1 Tax=Cutaneotrichosporon cavernicola TaxID=279322 RepID=A0AA48IIZ2_9TREE|nr:uncharacterized protein CcaverHIS019_0304930 [Cutaneotrichosporon cavernicola]BEI82629.1 hypothetical protein CcaverHIS002_0304970 [Cutaneotrichosporon cavernicola]BEI90423.1 hypothetical protein CcaverHIS019_0304930 [Cutaneotrichosporon cavernicola]BEI98198.1 hypothetical protein CcaverHIS631_0304970 [Cutaneotrichosporon cavernicola]BEJ05974.1 hypothetical protein CcaverHIS641_0304960 [Cutaneotrichosporon cavernicola]
MAPFIPKTRAGRTTSSFRARKHSSNKSSGSRARKARSIRPGTCANCACTEHYTNLWRSDRGGGLAGKNHGDRPMLCNACGLWLAEKGYPRPKEQWKWLKKAHEDALEARKTAIVAGADPANVPIEMFLPESYAAAPVMPIAAIRRSSSASDMLPLPPKTPEEPLPRLPSTPSPRVRARRRPSAILTKRPAPTTTFPAGSVDVELPPAEQDQHTAAKALLGLCTQAWEEKVRSPILPPTPTSPVRWSLLDGKLPSPSWIERRTRRPPIIPPPAGFHSNPRALTYDTDLPFDAGVMPSPSLPVPRQSGYRGLAASYFESSNSDRRPKYSSPPIQLAYDAPLERHSARRNSAISFTSTASSVLLTPPAETMSFAEPFGPAVLEKLTHGPTFQDNYHPPCHPAYIGSAVQGYAYEYHYQQFVSAYKPKPQYHRYQPEYPAQGH